MRQFLNENLAIKKVWNDDTPHWLSDISSKDACDKCVSKPFTIFDSCNFVGPKFDHLNFFIDPLNLKIVNRMFEIFNNFKIYKDFMNIIYEPRTNYSYKNDASKKCEVVRWLRLCEGSIPGTKGA